MIDCYRDPSVLQFVAISASDAWKNVKKGNLLAAARNVFDGRKRHLDQSCLGRSQMDRGRVKDRRSDPGVGVSPAFFSSLCWRKK